MAFNELIKNFNKIRDYMREFYVYGFKSRDDYTRKSARSYDDERRRVESWLGDYMQFRQTPEGKNVFLSIDSRSSQHNPLYKAWKACSFTDGDITLHFIVMDILQSFDAPVSISKIMDGIDERLSDFDEPRTFDESTVRKKLKEYVGEGIIRVGKQGRSAVYSLEEAPVHIDQNVLDFYSEAAPLGVVGSYLLDKEEREEDIFSFKHHYITGALDCGVLCDIFRAMREKRECTLTMAGRRKAKSSENHIVPLKIMMSSQNGRQYVMAYETQRNRIQPVRLDNIYAVSFGDVRGDYDELREKLEGMMPHIWGVGTEGVSGKRMEHVDFTVRYTDDEQHILKRLEREKRCGTVEVLDGNHARFSADVFDSSELIPWMRTFICRITEIHFSCKKLEQQFSDDIRAMYEMYGLEGGDVI